MTAGDKCQQVEEVGAAVQLILALDSPAALDCTCFEKACQVKVAGKAGVAGRHMRQKLRHSTTHC